MFSLFRSVSGSFVARASASPDPIRYELSAGAGNFYAIDNATGVITVQRRFDREVCGLHFMLCQN